MQLILLQHKQSWFTWLIHKWITVPFFLGSGVFCGWEVMLKLFWKLRKVIMHQLEKEGPGSVSFKASANVWIVPQIPTFIHHLHNSSLTLNATT